MKQTMKTTTRSLLLLLFLAACKTVVTTTTEIRPSRYAAVEFTRQVSHDRIMTLAREAVVAEKLKLLQVDHAGGVVTAGPATFAAEAGQPALAATVTVSTQTTGNETRVRIFASSTIEPDEIGGRDPRLSELTARISARLNQLIGN